MKPTTRDGRHQRAGESSALIDAPRRRGQQRDEKVKRNQKEKTRLTNHFGPLGRRPPLGVLLWEQGARPVGGQRHFVDHELVGIASGRVPRRGRRLRVPLAGARLGVRRVRQQHDSDEQQTSASKAPHFCRPLFFFAFFAFKRAQQTRNPLRATIGTDAALHGAGNFENRKRR